MVHGGGGGLRRSAELRRLSCRAGDARGARGAPRPRPPDGPKLDLSYVHYTRNARPAARHDRLLRRRPRRGRGPQRRRDRRPDRRRCGTPTRSSSSTSAAPGAPPRCAAPACASRTPASARSPRAAPASATSGGSTRPTRPPSTWRTCAATSGSRRSSRWASPTAARWPASTRGASPIACRRSCSTRRRRSRASTSSAGCPRWRSPRVLDEICFTPRCEHSLGDTSRMLARTVERLAFRTPPRLTNTDLYALVRASDERHPHPLRAARRAAGRGRRRRGPAAAAAPLRASRAAAPAA